MINNYSEFIIDRKFDYILEDILFSINENNREFEWDLRPDKNKLEKFLKKLHK